MPTTNPTAETNISTVNNSGTYINTEKYANLLLRHDFINTIRHFMFQPLKGHPQGKYVINSISKVERK